MKEGWKSHACCSFLFLLSRQIVSNSAMPWTEEPGGLQSMELQRVGHDGVTNVQPQQQWFLSVPPPCFCCHSGLLWIKEHQVSRGALRCFWSEDQSSLAVLPMDYSLPTVSPGPVKTCTVDSLLQPVVLSHFSVSMEAPAPCTSCFLQSLELASVQGSSGESSINFFLFPKRQLKILP